MFCFLPAKKAPGNIRGSAGAGFEPSGFVSPGRLRPGELRWRLKVGTARSWIRIRPGFMESSASRAVDDTEEPPPPSGKGRGCPVLCPHSQPPSGLWGSSAWNSPPGRGGRCGRSGVEPSTVPVWDLGQSHPRESALPARDGLGWVVVPPRPAAELFLAWSKEKSGNQRW